MHDDLLRELTGSRIRARFLESRQDIPNDFCLTRSGLYEFYLGMAGDLAGRPVYDGEVEQEPDCSAFAFDFAQGWKRSGYIWRTQCGCLAGFSICR